MQLDIEVAPDFSLIRRTSWFFRWALSALLLIGGLVVLSLDSPGAGIWWLPLELHHFTFSLPLPSHFLLCGITFSILTTALFLGWKTLRSEARKLLEGSFSDSYTWLLWLLTYVGCVAALAFLLGHTIETFNPLPFLLIAAVLICAAAVSWCLATMPAPFWGDWLSSDPWVLPGAAFAGALTYLAGHHLTYLVVTRFDDLVEPLQRSTLWLVAILLRLFVKDIVFEPQKYIIGTQQFSVFVDTPCAGWEGIGLFLTFFSIFLLFYRRNYRFPQVLILLPIGALIVWLSNAIRLVLLVIIGSFWPWVAIEGFHSVAGWLFFDAVTVVLVAISRQLTLFSKTAPLGGIREITAPNSAAPYLVPLMTIIAISMVTRVFFIGFDAVYPVRLLITAAVLWFYRDRILLSWKPSWTAVLLGLLGFGVWLALPLGDQSASTDAAFSLGLYGLPHWGQLLWVSSRALGAIVVIPVAEELAFRGYLLRKLIRSDFESVPIGCFTWFSFLTCSILFGTLHARWLAGILAGMIFAVAVYRRGLLSDAIVSHSITNGLLAAYVVTTHQWYLWN